MHPCVFHAVVHYSDAILENKSRTPPPHHTQLIGYGARETPRGSIMNEESCDRACQRVGHVHDANQSHTTHGATTLRSSLPF